jgi:diadenosine tetraphosphatase ApaH/serine/threonine PP2A family protein phosphatase
MRLALFSDIHGNIQALEACLAHAQGQQAERFAFLGDMVGYGADPVAVVQRVQGLVLQGACALQGNHDAMAVNPPQDVQTIGESTARWTHKQLQPEQRAWLAELPLTAYEDTLLLIHASAQEPALWHYVYDQRSATASLDAALLQWPGVRYVLGGHVHMQTLYYRGSGHDLMLFKPQPGAAIPVPRHRQWVGTIGSVGQPRDGNTLAMYALLDTGRAQLTYHRVPYDFHAAAEAVRQAGLPAFFADRLEAGR